MSRRPPIPPASRPIYGPDARPKTSFDVSHRVQRQARRAAPTAVAAPEEAAPRTPVALIILALLAGVLLFQVTTSRR